MTWKTNPIMEWSTDGGTTWTKVTDHGRSSLTVDIERIETEQRMVNGTKRRYVVGKKRTFSCSWENLPDKSTSFLANGTTYGRWFEAFHNTTDGAFLLRLRSGSDSESTSLSRVDNVALDDYGRLFTVMITEYSKEIVKRSPGFDLWTLSITLEEV